MTYFLPSHANQPTSSGVLACLAVEIVSSYTILWTWYGCTDKSGTFSSKGTHAYLEICFQINPDRSVLSPRLPRCHVLHKHVKTFVLRGNWKWKSSGRSVTAGAGNYNADTLRSYQISVICVGSSGLHHCRFIYFLFSSPFFRNRQTELARWKLFRGLLWSVIGLPLGIIFIQPAAATCVAHIRVMRPWPAHVMES